MDWLGAQYLGYGLGTYLMALATFLGVLLGFRLAREFILVRLRVLTLKTKTRLDDLVIELLQMIRTPEQYLVAFYIAARPFQLPGWMEKGFRGAVVAAVTYRAMTMLQRALAFAIEQASAADPAVPGSVQTARTLTLMTNAAIWILGVLFVLSNLGFNITSMIAGLGIGGIAVALAAQAVLGDLFSAVAIWLDRPFEIGDFIAFDGHMGTVDDIGIKTTRVRSLSGELLVVPNATLTSAKIRNYQRMRERRVVLNVGAAYKTPHDVLAKLPGMIEKAVRAETRVRFDRVHLDKFGESSIDLELVYWVLSPDYNVHMDLKQAIMLAILRLFESEGVEIPFPHRTVYLEKTA